MLLMPGLKPHLMHVMDADVAKYFFHTELYYAAAIKEIESSLSQFDEVLRDPNIRVLVSEILLPEPEPPAEDEFEENKE